MNQESEYRLRIDAFTLSSLPMSRLAEYMKELAELLGEKDSVHFSHMEAGSAVLVSNVEEDVKPKVQERLQSVSDGTGSVNAMKAYKAIDDLLEKDNAEGQLTGENGQKIINFPGRTRPKPITYGPFREDGFIDGVIMKVGGRDNSIPIWIEDNGVIHHCQTNIELSKSLANHYRKDTLRVYGSGKWFRDESGSWILQQFDIKDFEVLDDRLLTDVVGELNKIEGGQWMESKDPIVDLLELRQGDGDVH